MDKKDKLITLKSGRKFVIFDFIVYNDEKYYFANEIINDDVSENFKIFKIKNNDKNEEIIENITNSDIIKRVCEILDKKMD